VAKFHYFELSVVKLKFADNKRYVVVLLIYTIDVITFRFIL